MIDAKDIKCPDCGSNNFQFLEYGETHYYTQFKGGEISEEECCQYSEVFKPTKSFFICDDCSRKFKKRGVKSIDDIRAREERL